MSVRLPETDSTWTTQPILITFGIKNLCYFGLFDLFLGTTFLMLRTLTYEHY
jgi:hypothetical protein